MEEVIPVMIGAFGGLLLSRVTNQRMLVIATVILSLVGGFVASLITGELSESVFFVLVDALQVAVAAGAVVYGLRWWAKNHNSRLH